MLKKNFQWKMMKSYLKTFNFKLMKGEKNWNYWKERIWQINFFEFDKNKNIIDEGNIKIRKNLGISYFDQSGEQFNDNKTIKENMIPGGGDYLFVGEKNVIYVGILKTFYLTQKKSTLKLEFYPEERGIDYFWQKS